MTEDPDDQLVRSYRLAPIYHMEHPPKRRLDSPYDFASDSVFDDYVNALPNAHRSQEVAVRTSSHDGSEHRAGHTPKKQKVSPQIQKSAEPSTGLAAKSKQHSSISPAKPTTMVQTTLRKTFAAPARVPGPASPARMQETPDSDRTVSRTSATTARAGPPTSIDLTGKTKRTSSGRVTQALKARRKANNPRTSDALGSAFALADWKEGPCKAKDCNQIRPGFWFAPSARGKSRAKTCLACRPFFRAPRPGKTPREHATDYFHRIVKPILEEYKKIEPDDDTDAVYNEFDAKLQALPVPTAPCPDEQSSTRLYAKDTPSQSLEERLREVGRTSRSRSSTLSSISSEEPERLPPLEALKPLEQVTPPTAQETIGIGQERARESAGVNVNHTPTEMDVWREPGKLKRVVPVTSATRAQDDSLALPSLDTNHLPSPRIVGQPTAALVSDSVAPSDGALLAQGNPTEVDAQQSTAGKIQTADETTLEAHDGLAEIVAIWKSIDSAMSDRRYADIRRRVPMAKYLEHAQLASKAFQRLRTQHDDLERSLSEWCGSTDR